MASLHRNSRIDERRTALPSANREYGVLPEPGAIVCRVAESFIRFGSFQIHAMAGDQKTLRALVDNTVRQHFPHHSSNSDQGLVDWLKEVADRTALTIAHWMRVGFVHGVMNTDNMSIHGLTIDYGPYGWLEGFDPDWTPNTTDAGQRRYRYGQQPAVAQWNLLQLANALYPLIEETKPLEDILGNFATHYEAEWQRMMANKLGLPDFDKSLTNRLLKLMTETETDMTLFFRHLADVKNADTDAAYLQNAYYTPERINLELQAQTQQWLSDYLKVAEQQGQSHGLRAALMNRTNPLYVPRNYLAQLAIDDADRGDFQRLHTWMDVLQKPYTWQEGMDEYAQKRPEWARNRSGCSMLSCSS